MAQIRNNFIKSKMNRDLDSRLVPPGEYREALNVSVSKSEGADVGSLENISGNFLLTNFGFTEIDRQNVDVIGYLMDLNNDRIFVFMTNYVDTSADRLSNFAVDASTCAIGVYNTISGIASILIEGVFLNFSKTHSIYGVNLIDNNLFFTDDRNQPRKFNVKKALSAPSNNPYYTLEDQISIVKYYPFNSIDLIENAVVQIREASGGPGSGWTIQDNLQIVGGTGVGLTVNVISTDGSLSINNPGYGYSRDDIVSVDPSRLSGSEVGNSYELVVQAITTLQDVVSEYLPNSSNLDGGPAFPGTPNPYYNANWPGDKEYLKEKFVRFSYRFKFEDNEYSLIAPFTQEAFIPQQDGYFIKTKQQTPDPSGHVFIPLTDDLQKTYQSTEIDFFQNKVNNIGLIIKAPLDQDPDAATQQLTWTDAVAKYKIAEIEIIYKDASETNLKVVDTIKASALPAITIFKFDYQSTKPFRTLPTSALIRVSDQAPVRAFSQEVAGNRVIYGNFLDKHTPPESINYNVEAGRKLPDDVSVDKVFIEYQNHTLKQNRNYQVGIVLSDRYGRQSDVILSSIDSNSQSSTLKGSTLFHPFKPGEPWPFGTEANQFSQYPGMPGDFLFQGPNDFTADTSFDTWPGDSLKVKFNIPITSLKNNSTGVPGLYSLKNPTGWYSYKVVVKQVETDYYNVYFPGVLNGYIDGESQNPLSASVEEPVVHIVLFGDNVNKIPKDVGLVGPNQNLFRTQRPSFKDDPGYYQFTDTNGNLFDVDPYTEEGETLLKTRDRERDLDSGSLLQNSSVKLLARVINGPIKQDIIQGNQFAAGDRVNYFSQKYPGTSQDTVTTIGTSTELGLWDASAKPPYNEAPVFYNYQSNPFIARINLGDFNSRSFAEIPNLNPSSYSNEGVENFGQRGPSPNAGVLTFNIINITTPGAGTNENYPPSGTNVPVQTPVPKTTGMGTGMVVNFTASTAAPKGVTSIQIVDPGDGWVGPTTQAILNDPNAGVVYTGYSITAAGGKDPATTPQTGNVKFQVRVGYNKWGIGGGPGDFSNRALNSREKLQGMQPVFSCYETAPIISRLPIFWESTTSGIISKLNADILTGQGLILPAGFSINIGGGFNVEILESYKSGTSIIKSGGNYLGPFYATTAAGVKLNTADTTITLLSVEDGQGTSVINNFSLVETAGSAGAGGYDILTNTTNFYGANSGTIDVYSFSVNVNSRSATWQTDGTYVNTVLELGTWNYIGAQPSTTWALSNSAPFIGDRETGALTVAPNDPTGTASGIIPPTTNNSQNCTTGIYLANADGTGNGTQPTYDPVGGTIGNWIIVIDNITGDGVIEEVRYNGGNIRGFSIGDKIQFLGTSYGGSGTYEIVLTAADIGDIIQPGIIANISSGALTTGETTGTCGDLNWEMTAAFSQSSQLKTLCNIIGYNGMPTDTVSMAVANNEVGLGLTMTPLISNANTGEDAENITLAMDIKTPTVNQNSGMNNGAFFDVDIIPANQRTNVDGSPGQDLKTYGPFTIEFLLTDAGGLTYTACSANITFA